MTHIMILLDSADKENSCQSKKYFHSKFTLDT